MVSAQKHMLVLSFQPPVSLSFTGLLRIRSAFVLIVALASLIVVALAYVMMNEVVVQTVSYVLPLPETNSTSINTYKLMWDYFPLYALVIVVIWAFVRSQRDAEFGV